MNQLHNATAELEEANKEKWEGLKAMTDLLEGTYKQSRISKAISEASKSRQSHHGRKGS